jgi:phosphoenolpyruvate---glycerone phosphotransferase subunit DhaM
MVSLLLVSHSATLAAGVKELADQMAGGAIGIAAAGGTADGTIGTSADVIQQALTTLSTDDGVLVLVDLGSAVMSAEIALETSGLAYRISNAPLVEGAVFAAAHASIGASLDEVAAEAEKARQLTKVHP